MQRTPIKTWSLALGLATLAGMGCRIDDPSDNPSTHNDATLRRLSGCSDLRSELNDRIVEMLVDSRYGGRGGGWLGVEDDAADAPSGDSNGGSSTPTDFTTTNTQEAGVDEVDIVKPDVDGTHLFVAQDRALHIVKSWPADESEKLATMELDGWVHGLFLVDEDTAVVFESVDAATAELDDRESWRPILRIRTIDVSDRTDPVTTRVVDLDGYLVDARMIDGAITFVASQWMQIPQALWDAVWDDSVAWPEYPQGNLTDDEWDAWYEQARAEARTTIRPIVESAMATTPLSDVLPHWRTEASADPEIMHACSDLYAPDTLAPLAMLSVGTYEPSTGKLGATGVLSDGWTVYASQANLYVAQSSRWWWGWDEEGESHIHKFALHGGDEPTYEGSGAVSGWLYDQFAMSEFDGFLRVVSTDFTDWWDEDAPDPANNVYVLEDDGQGSLDVVGHLGGIAPNEQIRSARLLGDKGYVVTFEQVDPLFVLDLSDPTHPTLSGELKIPGFSAYLHPLGDTHLIGVGMSGLDTGELTGLAINLFDVSDPSHPTLQDTLEVGHDGGWAWSEALWDHHAFTYHRDTLTIPAFTESYDSQSQTWSGFSGTISFHVTKDDPIEEIGRVDHHDLVAQSECLWDRWYDWTEPGYSACSWDYGYWYAQIRRSIYIEDNLFTLSDYGIKVNDLNDPSIPIDQVLFYEAP